MLAYGRGRVCVDISVQYTGPVPLTSTPAVSHGCDRPSPFIRYDVQRW